MSLLLSILLLICGGLLILAGVLTKEKSFYLYSAISFIVSLLFFIFSLIVIINPGEIGLQILFGKLQSQVLHEGLNFKNPLVKVVKMDIRTQAYTMSAKKWEGQIKGDDAIKALSKDGLEVTMDITVWFRLSPDKAIEVYRTIGRNYVDKIVRPAIRTSIRDATVLYNAVDLYSEKRQEFSVKIFELLKPSLEEKGIIVEKVLVRNIQLPSKVKNAIEEKLEAEQQAQKMKFVLEKEKMEAERKRIEAKGIADANRIIANSLTEKYITWYMIEGMKEVAKNGNSTYFFPFPTNLFFPNFQLPLKPNK